MQDIALNTFGDSTCQRPISTQIKFGQTLVIAPTETGRLNGLASTQNVVFQRDGDKLSNGLTRWVFADLQRKTLKDQWNNTYDHEAHSLLVGS